MKSYYGSNHHGSGYHRSRYYRPVPTDEKEKTTHTRFDPHREDEEEILLTLIAFMETDLGSR